MCDYTLPGLPDFRGLNLVRFDIASLLNWKSLKEIIYINLGGRQGIAPSPPILTIGAMSYLKRYKNFLCCILFLGYIWVLRWSSRPT
jgi:hypothetical protein